MRTSTSSSTSTSSGVGVGISTETGVSVPVLKSVPVSVSALVLLELLLLILLLPLPLLLLRADKCLFVCVDNSGQWIRGPVDSAQWTSVPVDQCDSGLLVILIPRNVYQWTVDSGSVDQWTSRLINLWPYILSVAYR